MDELIERLRTRAAASGGDKLLEEAAAALEAVREDAANMASDAMLLQQDAERYRWAVRRHPLRFQRLIRGSVVSGRVERKDLIDAAIDRAIVGEQQGDRKDG